MTVPSPLSSSFLTLVYKRRKWWEQNDGSCPKIGRYTPHPHTPHSSYSTHFNDISSLATLSQSDASEARDNRLLQHHLQTSAPPPPPHKQFMGKLSRQLPPCASLLAENNFLSPECWAPHRPLVTTTSSVPLVCEASGVGSPQRGACEAVKCGITVLN